MPTLTYPHWRDVPATAWRWPNFSAAEIACRGTGAIKINTEAMDKLQALRDRLDRIETDIRSMRDMLFDAFQRGRSD